MAIKIHSSFAIHPGVWLKEAVVDPTGRTVGVVANHLGVSRPNLSRLLNGHAGLSAEMALRVEKLFGIKADTLLRMQVAHELATVRARADQLKVRRLPATA